MKLFLFVLLGVGMAAALSVQGKLPEVLAFVGAYILGGLVAGILIKAET